MPDRIDGWLKDPRSCVLVCVDASDIPVAVAHAVMLSTSEAWLEAARVHPDHRRSGLGSALNEAGVAWAREQGAQVVRLATEAVNKAARSQVESLGYRNTSTWSHTRIEVPPDHRATTQWRMRPAPSSDVAPAWMFWSTSELCLVGRGLIANGWQWRKAVPADLSGGEIGAELFQNPAGWAIADQPTADEVRVGWLATSKEDAPRLLEGLIGLAADREAARLALKLPNVPWAAEALTRAGGDPGEILVYSKAVV